MIFWILLILPLAILLILFFLVEIAVKFSFFFFSFVLLRDLRAFVLNPAPRLTKTLSLLPVFLFFSAFLCALCVSLR